jgi:hypothetical protein
MKWNSTVNEAIQRHPKRPDINLFADWKYVAIVVELAKFRGVKGRSANGLCQLDRFSIDRFSILHI